MVNKKGSLNLSIQMIVIVVIAFVVLGLGLGFVRTQFADIGDTTTAVQQQIEQQILDDLRRGNQKLSFPTDELRIDTGQDSVQSIGVKNTEDDRLILNMEFYVKAEGTSESGFEEFISEVEKTFTTVSGQEYEAKIIWDGSAQTFDQNEARVIPVTITAPDRSGTYLYKIVIRKDDGTVYDERTFFVRTT